MNWITFLWIIFKLNKLPKRTKKNNVKADLQLIQITACSLIYIGGVQIFDCQVQVLRAVRGMRKACSNYLEISISEVIFHPDFITLNY